TLLRNSFGGHDSACRSTAVLDPRRSELACGESIDLIPHGMMEVYLHPCPDAIAKSICDPARTGANLRLRGPSTSWGFFEMSKRLAIPRIEYSQHFVRPRQSFNACRIRIDEVSRPTTKA